MSMNLIFDATANIGRVREVLTPFMILEILQNREQWFWPVELGSKHDVPNSLCAFNRNPSRLRT